MKKERILWGILFLLSGISLILNKLGYFPDVNLFSLLLTVILVGIIFKSLMSHNFPGVLFPIAFICIIYDKQLGITAITPWTVLVAALFGSIGLSIIFYKRPEYYYNKYKWNSYDTETIDIEDESHIRFKTSFGGSIKYINTDKFEQADFSCHFGAMKVYFDNAIISNGKAVVRIDASFSGIELYIPKTWNIDDKTNVSFGGIDEKNRSARTETPTLTLVGDISFSGVEIIYI